MDQAAVLIYLRDVRDLEFALYQIKEEKKKETARFRRILMRMPPKVEMPLSAPPRHAVSPMGILGAVVFLAVVVIVGVSFLADEMLGRGNRYFLYIILFVVLFAILVSGFAGLDQEDNGKKLILTAEPDEESELRRRWTKAIAALDEEAGFVNELLGTYYRLEILPEEYRNFVSVYYIYEYMYLLQVSLSDTLASPQLDDAIERLGQKLASAVESQQDDIIRLRRQELHSPEAMNRNTDLLNRLSQTEANWELASLYSQLCVSCRAVSDYYAKASFMQDET